MKRTVYNSPKKIKVVSTQKNAIIEANKADAFARLNNLPDNALLKVSEAAVLLRVNRTTVYELMYHEGLKYIKVGCFKIKKIWVDEFLESKVA